jgi:hopene-associated glycosyltransferase HpnB
MLHWSLSIVALASLAAWAGLMAFRGRFWLAAVDAHLTAGGQVASMADWASAIRVEVVIPARDEATVIAQSLPSVIRQRFAGEFRVTLVDDHSADGTASVAHDAATSTEHADRFEVLTARELEPGWTGKLNALESGIRAVRAARGAADYWLFTDADIRHDPDNLSRLVETARRDDLALISSMVHLHCATFWERLLIPAFVFFFQKLYPFAWANDPRHATAAAAGGCILVSNAALERVGGLAAIADRLIDDCALAAAVKKSGGRIRLGLSDRAQSIRAYDSLEDIWRMVKRSAFTQLDYSWSNLLGTVLAMSFLYLVPPACVLAGLFIRDPLVAILGGAAWFVMSLAYLPTLRVYRARPLMALTLPAAAALYTAMTVDSALSHRRRLGGDWKGRTYAFGDAEPAPKETVSRIGERFSAAH